MISTDIADSVPASPVLMTVDVVAGAAAVQALRFHGFPAGFESADDVCSASDPSVDHLRQRFPLIAATCQADRSRVNWSGQITYYRHDWAAVFASLRDLKYDGWAMIESVGAAIPSN